GSGVTDCGASCPRSCAGEEGSFWPSGSPVLRRMGLDSHILSDRRLPFSRPQVAPRLQFPRSGFVQPTITIDRNARSRCTGNRDHHRPERAGSVSGPRKIVPGDNRPAIRTTMLDDLTGPPKKDAPIVVQCESGDITEQFRYVHTSADMV